VTGGRQVPFQDTVVRQYAREIAQDEIAHVQFLRGALGAAAVAQPAIDIGSDPNGAFSSAARAAGLMARDNRSILTLTTTTFCSAPSSSKTSG
jgi:hypothetical protein